MLEKIQSRVAHFYARWLGGVTEVTEYTAADISKTVYWYRQDDTRSGDYSLLSMTIHIDEKIRDDHSEEALEYVFLHEVGHDQAHPLIRILIFCLYLITGFIALATWIALPAAIGIAVSESSSALGLLVQVVVFLLMGILGTVPFFILSWIDEGYAELFAISKIGLQQHAEVVEELTTDSDAGLFREFRYRVQYPPRRLVRWVASRFDLGAEK